MISRRNCVFGQSQPRTKAVCLAWPWIWILGVLTVDAWNGAQFDLEPKLVGQIWFSFLFDFQCDLDFYLISNMTLQMQISVGPFMGCYSTHQLEVWLGEANMRFLLFFRSLSKIHFYENFSDYLIKVFVPWPILNTCCTCILVGTSISRPDRYTVEKSQPTILYQKGCIT